MGRVEGRSREDTRRMILEAAARVVLRDGLAATLDQVAAEAGVSKGGLLYHYASKRALIEALAVELFERFRVDVEAAVEPEDTAPGRLARAYVRVSLAEAGDAATMRDNVALAAHLSSEQGLEPIARRDAERWQRDLEADGLPAPVIRLVVAASDGMSVGPLWGASYSDTDLHEVEALLLTLTRRPAMLDADGS